jgi:hypothetical protein
LRDGKSLDWVVEGQLEAITGTLLKKLRRSEAAAGRV